MTQNYTVDELKKAVAIEADEREYTAAMNGSYSDGGATALREQLRWYEMGERGTYPKDWEKYSRHVDAEYAEFLRLQKKFGGGK